ncbi:putative pre-16S rRNA nuclease [Pseudodesulfovibrio profundus]|uniref:Putative pre-16S rRNA nuclease n=1 Tax=Pseudodesulfovibrio profundus TaxID=57320 RepID=A0A2C8FB77_9BACT|nr:Holliday junction resolvase RuvX [Pseudodesulfovibrio profundus]MBC15550.1 Holliday junction resolvase RuvX [Desulfovibrio sp.]SOB59896.1 putative pre-16S rRNA nuclease [Pseudodesulfovibrio profundus]|tara:strand:+ start:882 stop:1292 length:411 start_codon:yes stop_codon:yes gene_type:complete
MRALGIDFGLKRVGLAVSDPTGTLVSPYKTIVRTTRDALFDEILDIIVKESIETVVVGLPLSLDGEDTLTTRQARNFAQSLERRTDKPILLMDERLSSAQAEEELNAADVRGRKRKMALDSQAAVIILRSWLESGH